MKGMHVAVEPEPRWGTWAVVLVDRPGAWVKLMAGVDHPHAVRWALARGYRIIRDAGDARR